MILRVFRFFIEKLILLLFPDAYNKRMLQERFVLLHNQRVVEFVGGPRDGQLLRSIDFEFVARNYAMWWINDNGTASFYALENKNGTFQMSYVGSNSEILFDFLEQKYGGISDELKTASSFLKAVSLK